MRALLLLLFPAVVCAAPDLIAQADEAFQAGEHLRALQLLEKAWRDEGNPAALANQGLVLEAMGQYARAAEAFDRYLDTHPPEDKRQAAGAALDRLRPEVLISSQPAGAAVRIDGAAERTGTTPFKLRLVAGAHFAELSLAGHERLQPTFEIEPGQPANLRFVLAPLAVEPTPVPVDEPLALAPPSVGVAATTAPAADGWGRREWGWTSVAAGGVFAALAGTFLGLTYARLDARDRADDVPEWRSLTDDAETFNGLWVGSAVLAGAALTTGVTLLLWDRGDPGQARLGASPGGVFVRF